MAALPFKSFGRVHASTPLRYGQAIRYNLSCLVSFLNETGQVRIFTTIPHATKRYNQWLQRWNKTIQFTPM